MRQFEAPALRGCARGSRKDLYYFEHPDLCVTKRNIPKEKDNIAVFLVMVPGPRPPGSHRSGL